MATRKVSGAKSSADRNGGERPRHSHGGDDIDWSAMGDQLERDAEVHMQFLEQAVSWLVEQVQSGDRPSDITRVLDVGSGPGVVACLFARHFPSAEVIAVDGSEPLLERTKSRASAQHLDHQVGTFHVDLVEGLGELPTADLIWSSNAIHHLGDQEWAVTQLAGRLRTGGLLAIAEGGLPLRFLPRDIGRGRPGFQARMDAAREETFIHMRAGVPGSTQTPEDWPAMFERAGLKPSGSPSFLAHLPAPLGRKAREYLHGHLDHLRQDAGDHLAPDDRQTLDDLLDGGDDESILTRPDAFYLIARTVHTARNDAVG